MHFGVVVIGRNEGVRLHRCLIGLPPTWALVYVDSASSDGSAQWAQDRGIEVIELDSSTPFTAARARNAGLSRLRILKPDLQYVQFVDGDCELNDCWVEHAVFFLDTHPDVGAVAGRLRERNPDRSIYNWLCDREWDGPTGEVRMCGGIAMMRATALESVGGFRNELIAGEEPELCVRLRAAGWKIWRLSNDMALHDAAMTSPGQWWKRSIRSGYVFAQGAHLHGSPPERHLVWESRRAWLWGVWLPLACLMAGLIFPPWGWTAWLVYPLQMLRQTLRNSGPMKQRALLAFFQTLTRFPEGWGQIRFLWDRMFVRRSGLIEYK